MNSASVMYGESNDENYTPDYGVLPILKYIPREWVVWCPFDSADSEFVKLISRTNKVIHSHISEGKDFLIWEPEEKWDCIVSNPPFKDKRKFFERALDLKKPFALLMANTWLNDSAPVKMFKKYDRKLQLIMFDKRIKFNNNEGRPNDKITFSTSYFCCDFMVRDISMEILSRKTVNYFHEISDRELEEWLGNSYSLDELGSIYKKPEWCHLERPISRECLRCELLCSARGRKALMASGIDACLGCEYVAGIQ